jgi:protein-tyrosine-phosphatase
METIKAKIPKLHFSIWGLALGYFAFYVPYSGMTKALSKGFFSTSGTISGFELLPAVLFGTVIGFLIIILATGWWKQAGTVKLFGKNIPFASNKYTFLSGIATAVIIATTTLAYSFTGISIVFAALLMRGGVLLMAPFVDTVYRRKIQWYSWLAFGLTLFSLLVVFSEKAGYSLSLAAGINIAAYLSGYFFRLQFMTYTAKTNDTSSNYKYFVEEMLSAMLVILFVPLLLALIGQGELMLSLRAGYTSFLGSGLVVPAIIIGILYSCLYIFGSRIYLDKRENTFCIPINRCASLLAGVTAAVILSMLFEKPFYTATQLMGAVVLILAIVVLSTPKLIEIVRGKIMPQQRTYVFVCPGNRGRSPMAQAICIDRMVAHLESQNPNTSRDNIRVISAGITGEEGAPISDNARSALQHLGVEVMPHTSKRLATDEIAQFDRIWCMSMEHQQLILEKFPEAVGKVNCLDEEDRIPIPHGNDVSAYIECAQKLEQLIDDLISKKEIEFA